MIVFFKRLFHGKVGLTIIFNYTCGMFNSLIISGLCIPLSFLTAMVFALVFIPRILVIAKKYSIFDIPNGRKTHHGSIPRLGGVSFTPSVIFAMTFTIGVFFKYINKSDVAAYSGYYPDMMECNLFLCGLLLIYFGGVKDDLVGLRYRHKFLIQILSAMLVVFSGIYIDNFYGLLGIHEVVPWIGIPLTVIILIFVINAINLIDGIDGLASSISIFACCIYGTLFLFHGLWVYAALAFSTVGALIPFFCYNVFGNIKKGRKLFMGDAGSLTLGFILSYLSVRYICHIPEFMMAPIGNALVVAVSPILIPMLDVVRVVLVRLRKRRHIFKADRNHIHHKLLDMGMSKSSALLLILSLNATFCIINFILMQHLNCTFIFLTDILLWSAANIYFSYVKKKRNVSIAVY